MKKQGGLQRNRILKRLVGEDRGSNSKIEIDFGRLAKTFPSMSACALLPFSYTAAWYVVDRFQSMGGNHSSASKSLNILPTWPSLQDNILGVLSSRF